MMMCLAIQPDNLAIIPEMRSMREKRNGNLMADFVLEGNGNRGTSYSSFVCRSIKTISIKIIKNSWKPHLSP